jgi:hypothetical protein
MALNKDNTTTKHESFGLAGFSRITSSQGTNLFGSSIQHNNTIVFRLQHAKVDRHLEQDWYHTDGSTPIVEIEMSQTQFAEMITSMNMGDGVPVTIRHVQGSKIEPSPYRNKRAMHAQEFKQTMQVFEQTVKETSGKLLEMISKLPKKDQDQASRLVSQILQEIGSNIPFYEEQFQRQMDRTVKEAKGEVEAFIQNRTTSAGLKLLQGESELPTIQIEETGQS